MEYVTIGSTGNTTDFGDLTVAASYVCGGSNATRGTFSSGLTPSEINTIEYITIASTGDATDFGDLIATSFLGSSAACNGHGGLA